MDTDLRKKLDRIKEIVEGEGPMTCYSHSDDEIGSYGCCYESCGREHAPDCWYEELKRLVKDI